jgi:hypothetical protein
MGFWIAAGMAFVIGVFAAYTRWGSGAAITAAVALLVLLGFLYVFTGLRPAG